MGRRPDLMYILVVIFLGMVVLVTFLNLYLDYRRERRRAKRWLDSQPPEVITSGRQRGAEKARALLQEQIDWQAFQAFIEEFGQSQDPEIQELVTIVAFFLREGVMRMSSKASSGMQSRSGFL